MSSLGTSKGILENAKFGVYGSVPVALTYLVATGSKDLKKLMGLRPYVVYLPEGVCPGMKRGREKAPDCVVVMQHGGGGSSYLLDMEPVFSMEEILGPFWDLPSPPPPEQQPLVIGTSSVVIDGVVTHGGNGEGSNMMDQIQNTTEWTFERLLEEELLTDTTPVANSSCPALNVDPVVEVDQGAMAPEAVSAVGDPMEYNAILKRKLEEDLMAFKMWRASTSGVNSEGSNNENGGDLHVRLTTSSSSRDPSPSDEDMDGEVEILGFKMPTEERVRKRKESNRESARRSRYRKAAHLKDLEDQVDKLKAENSCLLRRLAALNQKYNDATVDNRVLKADMETLRAKVKMGEDSLKRIIEMTSLTSIPIPELPSSSDVPVHIQDNIVNYFTTTPAGDALADNSFMPMPDPLPLQLQAEEPTINGALNATEMNQIATHCAAGSQPSMQLIQETMGAMMPTSSGSTLQESELLGPNETINMHMY